MSCNERTALLATQTQQGQLNPQQREQQQQQHIIAMPTGKAAKDYEPIYTTADHSYGLTLEELLPFSLDPWWQTTRRLCVGCLWLTFVLTLLASMALAYTHAASPSCSPNTIVPTTLKPLPTSLALTANATTLLLAS
ncbi:CG5697 [Drosophila busckii]|uniref:CG5697 n=1 Tax=Drosophila busckii TaxID=30019 RepID=A0A0M4EH15_DROBS|nr:uncharacterized protein LOC108602107 isoform X1 [Drosophila busckii]ALC47778.1 CG5697 [Drosophila busckii]